MRITSVKSGSHIDKILRNGTKVYSNAFVLFYFKTPGVDMEFAAIAGKKVFKHAIDRNFAKRRIRELVRATCRDCAGLQIALMARKPISTAKYRDLELELEVMLKKVLA